MTYNFHTTYTQLSPQLYQKTARPSIPDPRMVVENTELLKRLSISYESPSQLLISERPFAQAYAGHQFGHFTMLGDGRALMLGEHVVGKNRFDIQLKGSGITKFSRGGDGKATMNSMLREYLYSYAMKQLGIKTSESLAVIATGDTVRREVITDGAILIRVMQSHIRYGTFEFASAFCTHDEFKAFADYVIERHYPGKNYLEFFREVVKNSTQMVLEWYRVGFIHGVMNTDNMSITGETFDYGPCAFMNHYDLRTTFSQIDSHGRYSFGNQKHILKWNLAVLGSALIPLIDDDEMYAKQVLQEELDVFEAYFEKEFHTMMKKKLGGVDCVHKVLDFLQESHADYTSTFIELMYPGTFSDAAFSSPSFLAIQSAMKDRDLALMKQNNPQRILRNYLVEDALDAYEQHASLHKVNALLDAVSSPYEVNESLKEFQKSPSPEYDRKYYTHCNT